jgi:hypothetical protein
MVRKEKEYKKGVVNKSKSTTELAKNPRLKPISLWPLAFEDAIRGVIETGPIDDSAPKPKSSRRK